MRPANIFIRKNPKAKSLRGISAGTQFAALANSGSLVRNYFSTAPIKHRFAASLCALFIMSFSYLPRLIIHGSNFVFLHLPWQELSLLLWPILGLWSGTASVQLLSTSICCFSLCFVHYVIFLSA
ncbi:hypothetical protein V6N13_043403 [Hibiscus sabdariffa]